LYAGIPECEEHSGKWSLSGEPPTPPGEKGVSFVETAVLLELFLAPEFLSSVTPRAPAALTGAKQAAFSIFRLPFDWTPRFCPGLLAWQHRK